jgi:hypothetical protein
MAVADNPVDMQMMILPATNCQYRPPLMPDVSWTMQPQVVGEPTPSQAAYRNTCLPKRGTGALLGGRERVHNSPAGLGHAQVTVDVVEIRIA